MKLNSLCIPYHVTRLARPWRSCAEREELERCRAIVAEQNDQIAELRTELARRLSLEEKRKSHGTAFRVCRQGRSVLRWKYLAWERAAGAAVDETRIDWIGHLTTALLTEFCPCVSRRVSAVRSAESQTPTPRRKVKTNDVKRLHREVERLTQFLEESRALNQEAQVGGGVG